MYVTMKCLHNGSLLLQGTIRQFYGTVQGMHNRSCCSVLCINHYIILYITHVTGKNIVPLQLLHLQKLTINTLRTLNINYCEGRRLHGIMLVIILCTGEKEVAHKWGLIASICRKASNNDCKEAVWSGPWMRFDRVPLRTQVGFEHICVLVKALIEMLNSKLFSS